MADIIDGILRREGGFVFHPDDKGGATNFGITQSTLSDYRKVSVSVDDVRNLTEVEARDIYRSEYIEKNNFDKIVDPQLQALVVDAGVNHGIYRAARFLQRAVGAVDDGICGSNTIAAVSQQPAEQVYRLVLAERVRFYGKIITSKPSQAVFAAGWMNRMAEFIERIDRNGLDDV